MKKFNEYNKNEKIVRISNYAFGGILLLVSIIYTTIGWKDLPKSQWLQSIGPWLIILVPYIIETIFRIRFSNSVLTLYNVYIFFASFLGTTLHFYHHFSYYDNVMHGLFGYIGCIIGLYILIKFANYKDMSTIFIMITMFFVSMGCASLWEILEYTCDHLFGATSQGSPVNGIVSLEDTMGDIIMNFFGMLVFEIHYLIHKLTNKNLAISSIEKDFTNN